MRAVRVIVVVLLIVLGLFLFENLGASQTADTGDSRSSLAPSLIAEQTGIDISIP